MDSEGFPDPLLVAGFQALGLLAREDSVFDLELQLAVFQGEFLFLLFICAEKLGDRLVAEEESVEDALRSVAHFPELLQNKRLSLAARVLLQEQSVERVVQLEQVLVQLEAWERDLRKVDDCEVS